MEVKRVGGNRKPQQFRDCQQCGIQFGPISRLSVKFCSYTCKVKAQTTGRKVCRVTATFARNAQSLLAYHVRCGNVIRPEACESCGRSGLKIEGAHKDYSRPLDVRWLCRSCHVKWDKAEPKGVTVRRVLNG